MNIAKRILVTGASGQVGSEIRAISNNWPQYEFVFLDRQGLEVSNAEAVQNAFETYQPVYCVNCAAYTAVDKAEQEQEAAMQINGIAPGLLAAACKKYNSKFIHISTDYVFDGSSPVPYTEDMKTAPVNRYGHTKLEGERNCMEANSDSIIIRTAWVYSSFGNNFVKTMLRLMEQRPSIGVVNDQVGAPTYARDLATAILHIIDSDKWTSGIYHYSNKGKISWYDFAVAIKELSASACTVNPITTSEFPTPAPRPAFSLLDTGKIVREYNLEIPEWKESLEKCLCELGKLS